MQYCYVVDMMITDDDCTITIEQEYYMMLGHLFFSSVDYLKKNLPFAHLEICWA